MSHDNQHFDRAHAGATGIDTGKGASISRFVLPVGLAIALGWAYVNPNAVVDLLNIAGSQADAVDSVRRFVSYAGGALVFIVIVTTIVRTRRARREGIPPSANWN